MPDKQDRFQNYAKPDSLRKILKNNESILSNQFKVYGEPSGSFEPIKIVHLASIRSECSHVKSRILNVTMGHPGGISNNNKKPKTHFPLRFSSVCSLDQYLQPLQVGYLLCHQSTTGTSAYN
jgi:hypothetical protein